MIDLGFYEFLEQNKNKVWFSSYLKALKGNEQNCKKHKRQLNNYIYKAFASKNKV